MESSVQSLGRHQKYCCSQVITTPMIFSNWFHIHNGNIGLTHLRFICGLIDAAPASRKTWRWVSGRSRRDLPPRTSSMKKKKCPGRNTREPVIGRQASGSASPLTNPHQSPLQPLCNGPRDCIFYIHFEPPAGLSALCQPSFGLPSRQG